MLNDQHIFVIPCPKCGEPSEKSVGWLKAHSSWRCAGIGCGANLRHENTTFPEALQKESEGVFKAFVEIRRGEAP